MSGHKLLKCKDCSPLIVRLRWKSGMYYYKYTPMRAQVLTLQYMKNFYVTQNYVTNVVITDRINAVGNATILSFGSEFARDMGNVRLVIWAVWGNFPLNWGSAIKTENTRDT